MACEIDWNAVACCYGCVVDDIPEDLKAIIVELDNKIKDANGMMFTPREYFGSRSTQVIGLVVLLYEKGILK